MSGNMLSPEERAERNLLMINFMSEVKQSFQKEMRKRDEEAYRRGTQLQTLFSLISPPGPHNPFSFVIDCGGRAKCAVTVSEPQTRSGLDLLLDFEDCDSGSVVYSLICDGQALKALAGAAEATPEQIAQVVIERLYQERLR